MSRPFVRVLGVALSVAGCHREVPPISQNPPAPVDAPPIAELPADPVAAPPTDANLPTWESIRSGHPEGATNPPYPLLVVSKSPPLCFKGWLPGMIKPDDEVMEISGRVVATPASVGSAVPVQCPEGQPDKLLAARAAWDASRK